MNDRPVMVPIVLVMSHVKVAQVTNGWTIFVKLLGNRAPRTKFDSVVDNRKVVVTVSRTFQPPLLLGAKRLATMRAPIVNAVMDCSAVASPSENGFVVAAGDGVVDSLATTSLSNEASEPMSPVDMIFRKAVMEKAVVKSENRKPPITTSPTLATFRPKRRRQ